VEDREEVEVVVEEEEEEEEEEEDEEVFVDNCSDARMARRRS